MRKQNLLRLTQEASESIDALAEELGWTRSRVVAEAVAFYGSERADLEIALSRLRDPNAEWVTHEQVKRELLGD